MGKVTLLLLLLICQLPAVATAASSFWPSRKEQVTFSYELFQWQEYLLNGNKLLTEQGAFYSLAFAQNNTSRPIPGLIYEINAKGYIGSVGYDGKSQNLKTGNFTPLKSTTDYLGFNANALLGQRYGLIMPGAVLDLKGGADLNTWVRNLNSAVDNAGQYATGYKEIYRVFSARAAAGLFYRSGKRYRYVQVGVKYPLDIWEHASNDTITLFPRSDFSFFASMEFSRYIPFLHPALTVRVYYDSYRFKASNIRNNTYQPESRMDLFGVSLTF